MDEHEALMDEAHEIRRALSHDDPGLAVSRLAGLVEHLGRHVQREEAGVFRALRDKEEFLDELGDLEAEHRQFGETISTLHASNPDFAGVLGSLLDDLGEHVEREDLGIFPVSVVTLGAVGWQTVDTAHARSPSFLLDAFPPAPAALTATGHVGPTKPTETQHRR